MDITGLRTGRARPEDPRMFERIFGDRGPAGGEDDLRRLLERADVADLPPLYLCCGTGDALIEDNVAFRDAAVAGGARVTADFRPGEHDWGYWDTRIQAVLAWLPLRPA